MPLVLPKFPHHWAELSAQAKGLLTPNEEKKKKLQKPDHEDHSEAHQVFRAVSGHSSSIKRKPGSTQKAQSPSARHPGDFSKGTSRSSDKVQRSALTSPNDSDHEEDDMLPGINSPGSTGVIFVMDRAMANGFTYDDPGWANFGQGAPEVGDIPGASKKPEIFDVAAMGEDVHEYAPTTGVKALRSAVADLYNRTYRQGMKSQYTFENVCIVPGGRSGLTRVASVVGEVYVGYQLPEYTAYDQMLSVFRRLVPIPSALSAEDNYKLHIDKLNENIHQMGLSVLFASNPRNPTGQAVEGNELKELVQISRNGQTVVLDEFYSWYNLDGQLGESLSAAKYVEDVNKDALVIIDGLTKNCLSDLPAPLNSGLVFFEELLKQKVIVVPGIFFDINPAHRRNLFCSPCHHFVRLSFGPPLAQLEKGLDGIEKVLKKAHEHLAAEGNLSGMGKDLARRVSKAAVDGVADSSKLTSPIE